MKYPLLVRVLQDVFADKTRRRVTQQEIDSCCQKLAQTVQGSYKPDLVVAIATGGTVPGKLIAKLLSVPVAHLSVRRNIEIARRYSTDPVPLRWIMSAYHHFLFQTAKPIVSADIEGDIYGKKILIVDDSLHTGATIDVAVRYLRERGVSEIKIASLAYVSDRRPDFLALVKGNYSFPWSRDFNTSDSGPLS